MAGSLPSEGVAGERVLPKERRMSLAGHLRELRRRLIIAALALLAGMIASAFLTDWIITWLTFPIQQVAENIGDADFTRLTFTTVTGPFDMRFRIALIAGIVLSSPVWLWQIWRFITPGLTRREFWYAIGFVGAAIPLFAGGVVLALFLLPNIITVMSSFFPDDIAQVGQLFTAIEYYNFVFRTLMILGVGCVTPVFIVALNLAGIVRGKQVILAWRWVLIVCLVFGMLVSPPADVITMVLVAGILFVLYMLASLVCLLFDWRRKKKNPDLFVELD